MLKNLSNVDEIVASHKATAPIISRNFDVKTKKEIVEKAKPINPKQIFEKTPKNTKKSGYRMSNVDNKKPIPAIPEDGI